MPSLSGSRRFQQLRTISGVVLFAYVLMHMLNHSLGLASLQAMDEWRWILSWQFPGGWIVILTAALVHSAHALWSLYDRRVMRMPAWQFMQLLLGCQSRSCWWNMSWARGRSPSFTASIRTMPWSS